MKSLNKIPKNFSDWEVTDNYEIIKQVGAGSYGYVVQAKDKRTGEKVAIKRFVNVFEDLIDAKRILREICILNQVKHENLIYIKELLPPKDKNNFQDIYMVTDYCQSDLKKLFKSPIHLENLHIQTLLYGMLLGLKFIHSCDILHRDLKPANVLLNEDCSVKICDFGLARSIEGIEGAHMYDADYPSDNTESTQEEQKEVKEIPKSELEKKNLKRPPKLSESKKKKSAKNVKRDKRELTGHVVTRWYRAPEVILLEKDYTSAIDMWSVGCIFAELQGMQKENAPTFMDRTPLFPGSSCFPLSPSKKDVIKRGGFPHSHTDQLNIIFSVLGTPIESNADLDFVTDSKAVEYLKSFPEKKKIQFSEIYPGSSVEAIDFLEKSLKFNPSKRVTIDEALAHPYLSKVRDLKKEANIKKFQVKLDFEQEGDLSEKRLRELFLNEIKKYNKI